MCMFYGEISPGADTEAIGDRLKLEFGVETAVLPPQMAELLRALAASQA